MYQAVPVVIHELCLFEMIGTQHTVLIQVYSILAVEVFAPGVHHPFLTPVIKAMKMVSLQ